MTCFLETSSVHSYLKGELGKVSQLITLEEPAGGVLEHGEGDAVHQAGHALRETLVGRGLLHRPLEDAAEGLGAGGRGWGGGDRGYTAVSSTLV